MIVAFPTSLNPLRYTYYSRTDQTYNTKTPLL